MNQISMVALLIALLSLGACKKNSPDACNGSTVRREVKIVTDEQASAIDLSPIVISVTDIGNLPVGEVDSDSPRQDVEKKVFTVTGTVHKLSKYRDGDWKVKLTDGDDNFLNCESPNPGCEHASSSAYLTQYNNVRQWIEDNKEDLVGKTVTITGVGFIDIDHRYLRNAAKNEMEIHPILEIHF